MRRKIWIKRKRPQYKLDRRQTTIRWAIIISVCVLGALLLSGLAYAQPELKVGQEVEIFIREKVSCKTNRYAPNTGYGNVSMDGSIKGVVKTLGYDEPPGPYKIIAIRMNNARYCVTYLSNLVGYRILKPAPRPEFKLPHTMPSHEFLYSSDPTDYEQTFNEKLNANDHAIARELRWLREKIEALKK